MRLAATAQHRRRTGLARRHHVALPLSRLADVFSFCANNAQVARLCASSPRSARVSAVYQCVYRTAFARVKYAAVARPCSY